MKARLVQEMGACAVSRQTCKVLERGGRKSGHSTLRRHEHEQCNATCLGEQQNLSFSVVAISHVISIGNSPSGSHSLS